MYYKATAARFTILHSHGNAEDIGDTSWMCRHLRDDGFNVLAYDYRGYRTSTGKPDEQGEYRDADAAYAYIAGNTKMPPKK